MFRGANVSQSAKSRQAGISQSKSHRNFDTYQSSRLHQTLNVTNEPTGAEHDSCNQSSNSRVQKLAIALSQNLEKQIRSSSALSAHSNQSNDKKLLNSKGKGHASQIALKTMARHQQTTQRKP